MSRNESPSERRLRLLDTYAYSGFALLTLYDGWRFFEPPETEGFIAYELHRDTAVVCGDPVCAEERLAEFISAFAEYCAAHGWRFAFVAASARVGKIAAGLGYTVVKIGEEPFLDLAQPNLRGNAAKKARAAINHAQQLGVSVEEYREASPALDTEIEEVAGEWLHGRRAPPLGFILRSRPLARRERKRIFLARCEGRIVAVITCAPAPARRLLYVEELLRRSDAPYGAGELLIATARQAAVADGAALFGLGLAPLCGATRQPYGRFRLLRLVIALCYARASYIYNFRSLNHFKKKFAPSFWEDSFLICQKRLLPVALAVVAALSPDTIPSLILPGRLQWLRRVPALALWLAAIGGIFVAGFATWEFSLLRVPADGAVDTAHLVQFGASLLRAAAGATLLAHRFVSSVVLACLAATALWRRRARV
jgi:phosphatidylglycerol lysyltransferase